MTDRAPNGDEAPTQDNRPDGRSRLADLVALVARALVDHADQVVVHEIEGGGRERDRDRFGERGPLSRIELRVAPEDIGKVIGKDGRTAQSIRTLLAAAASRVGRRAHLEILD